MAESSITITGLEELRVGVNRLPEAVTSALRSVAQTTAQRVLAQARANWQRQRKELIASGLAEAMIVKEDLANKMFVVESHPPKGRPAMVPIWLEYGTVKMPARPYIGPAAKAEEATYVKAMESAALDEAQKVFG